MKNKNTFNKLRSRKGRFTTLKINWANSSAVYCAKIRKVNQDRVTFEDVHTNIVRTVDLSKVSVG